MIATSAPSQSQQVRDWVDSLAEGTPFRISDVPVPAKTAKVALSRLAADPDTSGIKRLLQGTYLKGLRVREIQDDPEAERPLVWSFRPFNTYQMVWWYVGGFGRGIGYAGLDALHKSGWTDQVPVGLEVALVGKPPPSLFPGIVTLRGRSNRRRLHLTSAEVSIIEAARFSSRSHDEDLLPRLDRSTRNVPRSAVGGLHSMLVVHDYVIRPDALRWAVETEQCERASVVRDRVERFADRLPGVLRYQKHWPLGHLLDA